jgi:AcrR family transcriptional regulator
MGRPPIFDLGSLTAAGLDLVADDGWAAVSVRSVAGRLGVSTMALYRVVPDARDLRRAMADAVAEPIQPDPRIDDLVDALDEWARRAYRHLAHYRGLAAFVIGEWTELPRWLDIVEGLLVTAEADGSTGLEAVGTVNAVFAFVLARAQLRDSIGPGAHRPLSLVRDDPDRYPLIRRSQSEFAIARTTKHFHVGLDALTAGLRVGHGTPTRPGVVR